MPNLSELLSSFDARKGVLLPDSWRQGRTAYGGIVTALGISAALQSHATPLPPLRAMQVNFIGPAVGQLAFAPQVLREGKSVVSLGVDVFAEGALAARLMGVFGRARESSIVHDFGDFPDVPGVDECHELNAAAAPFVPAFLQNFQLKPAGGAMPVSAAAFPEQLAWVRHRDAQGVDPAIALAAMGDAMPPAAFTAYRAPAPVSSINWSFELLDPAPAGEWFLLRSFSQHARDGYSSQDMQVWNAQRQLVMRGRQSVAIFS